jgi:hypothetical protein
MIKKLLTAATAICLMAACTNGPGQGGKATITGKVHATNWNSTCTLTLGDYYAPDEDVYIIYGDDVTYGDRIKTGPDGTFQFKYLRPGKYTIYVYSKDCSTASTSSGTEAIKATVEITEKGQAVTLDDIEIKN